jgi:hypothetical protein
MRKYKNHYGETSIFELNMIGIQEFRKTRFSAAEAFLAILPFIMIASVILSNFIPELVFFADCKNIADGDICKITLG